MLEADFGSPLVSSSDSYFLIVWMDSIYKIHDLWLKVIINNYNCEINFYIFILYQIKQIKVRMVSFEE